LFIGIFAAGLAISYSPLGEAVFLHLFGAEESMLEAILNVYRILMFVSIFSGIRCLYHGIIISNMRTKWLTVGMVIRLVAMYVLSVWYIRTGNVTSGSAGAVIFLTGMMVEAAVSFLEGRKLVRSMPLKQPEHAVEKPRQIFRFYRPLLLSSFVAVMIGPAINAMLGKTSDASLSIAAFAIAASLTQLVQSFFSYMHQIVLNFYRKDPALSVRFALLCGFIPAILIAVLGYTPAGPFFMEHVMGVNERLMTESLHALRVFMLLVLLFPWLDFCNGLIMLHRQTKVMLVSQSANLAVTVISLFAAIALAPGWNSVIGALAQSLGLAAELAIVLIAIKQLSSGTSQSQARSVST
jgi:Na+-driven multidrug efflux pump